MNEQTRHALTVYNELADIAAEHNAPHHYATDITHDLAILLRYDPRRSFIWHLTQTGSHFAQIPDAAAQYLNPNDAADKARHAATAAGLSSWRIEQEADGARAAAHAHNDAAALALEYLQAIAHNWPRGYTYHYTPARGLTPVTFAQAAAAIVPNHHRWPDPTPDPADGPPAYSPPRLDACNDPTVDTYTAALTAATLATLATLAADKTHPAPARRWLRETARRLRSHKIPTANHTTDALNAIPTILQYQHAPDFNPNGLRQPEDTAGRKTYHTEPDPAAARAADRIRRWLTPPATYRRQVLTA